LLKYNNFLEKLCEICDIILIQIHLKDGVEIFFFVITKKYSSFRGYE
jgi:hypothetical protein